MAAVDADIILSGTTLNVETLIAFLEGKLPVKRTSSATGAGYSTIVTGTTTTLTSLSVTVEADELIVFWTTMQMSLGATNLLPHIRHEVGGTGKSDNFFIPPSGLTTGSTGYGVALNALSVWSGLSAGVTSFNLQWQNDGSTAGPLIYSAVQQLEALQFKYR